MLTLLFLVSQSNVVLGAQGGPVMKNLAQKALQACPSTKIAISGYSQGGSVVHYAVANAGLSAEDVAAAVIYGKRKSPNLPNPRSPESVFSAFSLAATITTVSYTHLTLPTKRIV